jgi:hypothetical protein
MPGNGPAPKVFRARRTAPARGDWKRSPEGGWQGKLPEPPSGLLEVSTATWETWFKAWWAAHWTTDDLPGLRLVIRIYDRVARGDVRRLGELRQLMDSYGITPKGQQDRRWLRPEPSVAPSTYRPGAGRNRDTRDVLCRRRDPRLVLRSMYSQEANR